MVDFARKCFAVIILKNLMLRTGNWLSTLICIAVIPIPFCVPTLIHCLYGQQFDVRWMEPEMFPTTDIYNDTFLDTLFLGYTPKNRFTERLMTETHSYLLEKKWFKGLELIPADGERTMMAALEEKQKKVTFGNYIGIVFDVLPDENFTTNLTYKIRSKESHKTKELFPRSQYPGPMDSAWLYLTYEFIGIQQSIDLVFINLIEVMQGERSQAYLPYVEIKLQYFPYPGYFGQTEGEMFVMAITYFFIKHCTIIALLFIPFILVPPLLKEKKSGVNELMKLRGLNEFIIWSSWQIYVLTVYLISVSIITVLPLKYHFEQSGSMIAHSHWTIIWLFFVLLVLSTVSFFYFVTTIFNTPLIALIIGIPFWLFLIHFPLFYNSFTPWKLMLILIIIPMLTIDYGFTVIIQQFESQGVGVHWHNMSEKCLEVDCILSMAQIFIVLLFSIAFYYAISWYMGSIKPGPFGRAKPWYFIFKVFARNEDVDPNISQNIAEDYKDKYEKAPNLNVGISIRNLRKTFNTGHLIAVDNVTMDIYEGLITVLLGQNGAGKTTMMNILTGMISPTSGEIFFYGKDIFDSSNNFCSVVTLCPQQDLFFPNFDCIQHLVLFGMLQGLSCLEAIEEGNELLNEFNIANKKHTKTKHLSGGMKRKLSLAMALIGVSEVNILDEPTSGLDPESRREVWDILLRSRGERMILITTHSMEEADVLGDRIAIMDHGNVHCYGTPLYLKRIYGSGFNYKLTILKNESKSTEAVTSIVNSALPGAIVNSQIGTVVTYSLPTALAKNLPALFRNLESEKARLGITGMTIAFTSMEDVFISVSQNTTDVETNTANLQHPLTSRPGEGNARMQISIIAFTIRFQTLMVKRIICGYRSWILSFCFLMVVLLFTWLAIHVTNGAMVPAPNPPLVLQLSIYNPTTVFFISDDSNKARIYEDLINHQGSECVRLYNSAHVSYHLMEISEIDIVKYRSDNLVAAEFNDKNHSYTALFSSIPYHVAPISLNLITNTLCKTINSKCSITTWNHPVSTNDKFFVCSGDILALYTTALTFSTLLGIGLLFQVGQCIAFPLTEHVNNVKQLQFMTGVGPCSYWLSLLVYDYILHIVTFLLMLACIFATDNQHIFTNPTDISVLSLLILLCFSSGTWNVYLFSKLLKSGPDGFSVFCVYNIIICLLTQSISLLYPFRKEWHKKAVMMICYLSPQCAAYYALDAYALIMLKNNRCTLCSSSGTADLCKDHVYKPYLLDDDFFSFRTALISLVLDTVLYSTIILLWDSDIFSICSIRFPVKRKENFNEDNDVTQEQRNVTEARSFLGERRKLLIVDGLRKRFCTNIAVQNVGFTVGSGECFGLLGVNGAGKTTTFRMLTGETTPNRGDAFILNYSLVKQKKKYLSHIGYCPQISGIIDSLTGEEMLTLFANLRGITKSAEVQLHINYWINVLGLQEFRKRKCGTYSGGNKRKLSTAIALIGDPAVVFLDEPTSGVDPVSRMSLWAALARVQKAGQAIVLTSHSMEECEALCNRLTIMVRGYMKCIGNIQYLKQKYGLGFMIMIKVSSDPALISGLEQLKLAVLTTFGPRTNLKDEHAGLLHYHIADPDLSWSKLYGGMEELKSRILIVEDFTISDTTLEQVFIEFAQQGKKGKARFQKK